MASNLVNLDALIRRADLAAPGEIGEDISGLSIAGLEPKAFLFPALRKPDFQRETGNWTPEQVADLISTFARRDLIPAVILWRAGQNVFVIDGAHRLSALIAWVHNDYGDGPLSRRFFQDSIPEEQQVAAQRARELVKLAVGSYEDHKIAIDYPQNARADIAERAPRIGWQEIPAQWIRNADHEKAEKAFFRINQGGTKIDAVERRILLSRGSATAIAARAILRAGTGHNYWNKFADETRIQIEELGGEINDLLFGPTLQSPIKTLDVPLAGQGYGAKTLPFVFDLVTVTNKVQVKDSSNKRISEDLNLVEDPDGVETVRFLREVRRTLKRICSNDPSSLGLHPLLYFYSRTGIFQAGSLLAYCVLLSEWTLNDYMRFTKVRKGFEELILTQGGTTEAIRKLGSGARSRPRLLAFYRRIISQLEAGISVLEIIKEMKTDPTYSIFINQEEEINNSQLELPSAFTREIKGAAFIKDALPTAPACPTCGGLLHRNGMQVGHIRPKRDGGTGTLENAQMQHPFCNSTYAN